MRIRPMYFPFSGLILTLACLAVTMAPGLSGEACAQREDHFRQEFLGLKFDTDPHLEGRCRDGDCMNGRGTVQLENGAVYIGEFRDGLKNGPAVRIGPTGDRYHQVWEKGVLKYNKRMYTLQEKARQERQRDDYSGRRKDVTRKRTEDKGPSIF
ncbi:hypothetical protein [Megalodesulfovibrio gigas]|uniref:Putative hipothetical protein n=1 Tax=Megalodesulfovibrio gigas (strain ATCC 19364 / DSM 1382 / NCIMB 9332 / VKM B-1759) TaxID=1121448 RepID=T2GCU8_MEGG1|nr:hypothetical protein [Megalodesulfovibrio gigas]AGW13732.1 putative hipothetical protein [Megalodesulfovibrio gigas DSM 1382 = ATCC 19364]